MINAGLVTATTTLMKRACLFLLAVSAGVVSHATEADLWHRDNLVAWCIVPYDAKKRGPEPRAEMLQQLGLGRLAYDYRAEHVPTFDAEVEAMKRHRIELTAWWFPQTLNDTARTILAVIERHGIKPQLWVSGGGQTTADELAQAARIESEAARIRPIAREAARLGLKVGLYNHGGWFGEPDNQIALLERLRRDGLRNIGLVYNFHHGHPHIDRFRELWWRMQPHVLAVNLNGMVRGGDTAGKKILYLGEGDRELEMMRVIQLSGWRGLVGVLNHRTDVDAEEALRKNLAGLDRLAAQLR